MKGKTIVLLFVVLLVVIGLVFFQSQKIASQTAEYTGDLLFPDLKERLNDVAKIEFSDANSHLTFLKKEDQWVAQEKDYYPADIKIIRNNLLALSEMKTLSPKTDDPQRYQDLEVQDLKEGSPAKKLAAKDSLGKTLASVIIGKQPDNNIADKFYVRIPGQQQAWLAKASLSVPTEPAPWLENNLLNINQKEIARAEFFNPEKGAALITKKTPEEKDFQLETTAPAGKEANQFIINATLHALELLKLQDVKSFKPEEPLTQPLASFTTFSGLQVHVFQPQKDWFVFQVTTTEAADETTRAKATQLSQKLSGWAYKVENFRQQKFTSGLSDFVREAEKQKQAS